MATPLTYTTRSDNEQKSRNVIIPYFRTETYLTS